MESALNQSFKVRAPTCVITLTCKFWSCLRAVLVAGAARVRHLVDRTLVVGFALLALLLSARYVVRAPPLVLGLLDGVSVAV